MPLQERHDGEAPDQVHNQRKKSTQQHERQAKNPDEPRLRCVKLLARRVVRSAYRCAKKDSRCGPKGTRASREAKKLKDLQKT